MVFSRRLSCFGLGDLFRGTSQQLVSLPSSCDHGGISVGRTIHSLCHEGLLVSFTACLFCCGFCMDVRGFHTYMLPHSQPLELGLLSQTTGTAALSPSLYFLSLQMPTSTRPSKFPVRGVTTNM